MNQENPIKITVGKLRKAIEDRDFLNFSREHARIVNFCRRALFHGDREALGRWYPEVSSVLVWFFRGGKADWPGAERSMGGLELLLSLMGNSLETRTLQEALADVWRSRVDRDILKAMSHHQEGMKSGDLAEQLKKSPNSVTNRLPGLEKMGLIIRSRLGKSSVVYLTPKGKGIAEQLRGEAASGACKPATLDESRVPQDYEDQFGQKRSPNEPLLFWTSPSTGYFGKETGDAPPNLSSTRTFH
jgi:DNA-binding MarR family transcriptional regulator